MSSSCAACGKAGQVKKCGACKLVVYCDANCQRNHRKAHRPECNRRVIDIKAAKNKGGDGYDQFLDEPAIDIKTFVLPPRPECPICFIAFPFEADRKMYLICCGKFICRACSEESMGVDCDAKIERGINVLDPENYHQCAFCRALPVEDTIGALKKLIERGDADAMASLAHEHLNGVEVRRDEKRAIDLYHKAAASGSSKACAFLAQRCWRGDFLSIRRDVDKARRLYSRAVRLGGDPGAMYNLGIIREDDGHSDFVYYTLASASAGKTDALATVKDDFLAKRITKEEYTGALRSYQTVHEELRSESRKKLNDKLARRTP